MSAFGSLFDGSIPLLRYPFLFAHFPPHTPTCTRRHNDYIHPRYTDETV